MQDFCDMHDVCFADVEPVYNMGAGMVAAVAADKAMSLSQYLKI